MRRRTLMPNKTLARYRLYGMVFIATLALGTIAGLKLLAYHNHKTESVAQKPPPSSSDRLIVHEWGTFTSIAGSDGVALEWRPLTAPSELPGFVHTVKGPLTGLRHPPKADPGNQTKADLIGLIRMETPVIYFYADRESVVSVKVGFPNGKITEWYPQARSVYAGIDWGKVLVQPGAQVDFPVEARASHYYPARETDSAPLRVCGDSKPAEYEKFLFYRGVGTFDLPLSVRLEGESVEIKNTGQDGISRLILFENRGGKTAYSVYHSLGGNETVTRPNVQQSPESLEAELEQSLLANGLYEKEAKAMIKTWRDTWFEEGMRVFYVLPRSVTDRVLPITIDPSPVELTRVLVGRAEIITPEMEREVRQELIVMLDENRTNDAQAFRKYGRFAEPILKRILAKETEERLRTLIESIIKS
jgi:hypothetical protein